MYSRTRTSLMLKWRTPQPCVTALPRVLYSLSRVVTRTVFTWVALISAVAPLQGQDGDVVLYSGAASGSTILEQIRNPSERKAFLAAYD